MKKLILITIIAVGIPTTYYLFTKPNGTKCDCAIQSYYNANKDYCNELSLSDNSQAWGEAQPNFKHCNFDVIYKIEPGGEYTKFDAVKGVDQTGLPAWIPVVMKDDGKYPNNEHAEAIEQALKTKLPTSFGN
jgi:hypothetical protein